jgi:alpha-tubulin suppressor-like RCC1 family protein
MQYFKHALFSLFIFLSFNLVGKTDDLKFILRNMQAQNYFMNLFPIESTLVQSGVTHFTLLSGNGSSNGFSRSIEISGDQYVIGNNLDRATLSRISNSGVLLWTNEVQDTSSWSDLIMNGNGNILLVGQRDRDITSGTPGGRDLLVGECTTAGVFLNLQSIDYTYQETYTAIKRNPNPANTAYPFYALGQAEFSADKPILSFLNNSGIELQRITYDYNGDDEVHSISEMNSNGDFDIMGWVNGIGNVTRIDRMGNVISSTQFSQDLLFYSDIPLSSGTSFSNVLAGTLNGAGLIAYYSNINSQNIYYTSNNLTRIYELVQYNATSFYALGLGVFSGAPRVVVMKFSINSGSINLDWARYMRASTNTSSLAGRLRLDDSKTHLILTEVRNDVANGYGSNDGVLSVQGLDFNDCDPVDVTINFTTQAYTPQTIAVTRNDIQAATPISLSAQTISYQSKFLCTPISPCSTSFTYQLSNCGEVNFFATTNLSSANYCWDFGDAPPCGSTLQNPLHEYTQNGTYTVCIEVSNPFDTCQFCQQIVINNSDNTRPIIICPPPATINDCIPNPLSSPLIGFPTVIDQDPNPVVTYNDILSQVSPCVKRYVRDWKAVDICGNEIHCQQPIAVGDFTKPFLRCPPNITVSCSSSIDTLVTGAPITHDYCHPRPFLQIKTDTPFISRCSTVLNRRFIVQDNCLNRDTCYQTITLLDTTKPLIICPPNIIGTLNCNASIDPVNTGTPTMSDRCGNVLNPSYWDQVHNTDPCRVTIIRTWTANDGCGNISTCTQTIEKNDLAAPLITNCGRKYIVQGVQIGNECIGQISTITTPIATDLCNSVTIINDINNLPTAHNLYPVGTTIITWTATDRCGWKTTCKDTVVVRPCKPPCDTCGSLSINVDPVIIGKDSCCYAIDISNQCAAGYFDLVELCTQDPSVILGNQTLHSSWNYCSSASATTACFEYNTGSIPIGTFSDVLKFCVDTQTNYIDTICWKKVVGGEKHTIAIDNLGRLWGWGGNQEGQLGNAVPLNYSYPVIISNATNWVDITAGAHHSIALNSVGQLWACGENNYGQLGIAPGGNVTSLTNIATSQYWNAVSTGDRHTIALNAVGNLFTWGDDGSEQLGNGPLLSSDINPKQIGTDIWTSIEAGIVHNLAIRSDSTLWAWGENNGGQVGDFTFVDKDTPIHILPLYSDFVKISAGYVSFAMRKNGDLWGWGANSYGQMGNNYAVWTSAPELIPNPGSPNTIVDFYTGRLHSILLDNAGNVYGTGYNLTKQLNVNNPLSGPNNDRTLSWIPIGITNAAQIFQGYDHNFAMTNTNQLLGWGFNHHGNLNLGNLSYCEPASEVDCIIEQGFNPAPPLPYTFKLKFYQDGEVACDKMFDIECLPDTLNSCLDIRNIVTECLYEKNKYKLTFTVSNTSNPAFTAASVVVSSADPNLVFTPSIIDFAPDLNSGQSQTVMTCIMTSPFTYSAGVANLQFQLISSDGRTICSEAEQHRVLLDECPEPCAYTCCENTTPEDFEDEAIGPLSTFQYGYVKTQGIVDVVQGGCDDSDRSIILNGSTKGLPAGIVSLERGGINGPIDFVKKDSMYCIKLCAYVPRFSTAPYDAKIGISLGFLPSPTYVGTITIPLHTVGWNVYSLQFTAPINAAAVNFSNDSPAPVDAPTSIQLDNICFGGSRPVFVDDEAPELKCPGDVILTSNNASCTVSYTIPSITVTDNYGVAFLNCYLDGVLVPIGSTHTLDNSIIHQVSYFAGDHCENIDSCKFTITVNCNLPFECKDNIVKNGDFEAGLIIGNLGSGGALNFWSTVTYTPNVNNVFGCTQTGSITMWGNQVVGESVTQAVAFNIGKTYDLTICAKDIHVQNRPIVGQVRIMACNLPVGYSPSPCQTIYVSPTLSNVNQIYINTFTANANYTHLFISPWNHSNVNHGDSTSVISIDDICIRERTSTCSCRSISDVVFGNTEFYLQANCNSKPGLQIPCPISEKTFNIKGRLNCSDTCKMTGNYTISHASNSPVITSGSLSFSSGIFSISAQSYSAYIPGETYALKLNGLCGSDTCKCVIYFSIQPCDTCCKSESEFIDLVNSAISINVLQDCKVTLNFDCISDCNIVIADINWGGGATMNGPIACGTPIMHTYPNQNVGYSVAIHIIQYDENGKPCNDVIIRKPVDPNCNQCCKDFKRFKYLIAQGMQVDIQDCKVKISMPQFNDCHYIHESLDWGDNTPIQIGVFPANQMWMHEYNQSGTYDICVTVYEKNGKNICWYREICEKVTVQCIDSCSCEAFENLMFKYDKTNVVNASCGDLVSLICPPQNCAWVFTGELNCIGHCPFSKVEWQITDNTGAIIGSGLSLAYPSFGIFIPPSIVENGGYYTLTLTGNCGGDICRCIIPLYFEGCNNTCPCDPQDLENDVDAGIKVVSDSKDCLLCFQPNSLSDCDEVKWYLLSNPNQAFASSIGNQILCYKFPSRGNYLVKMSVIRRNDDGTVCSDYERVFSIDVNCLGTLAAENVCIEPVHFSDNTFLWKAGAYILNTKDNNANYRSSENQNSNIVMGNENSGRLLISNHAYCIISDQISLTFSVEKLNNQPLYFGSVLKLFFIDESKDINQSENWINVASLDLFTLESDVQNLQLILKNKFCKDQPNHSFRIIAVLENAFSNVENMSSVRISNICINSVEAKLLSKESISIIPNPTEDMFNLSMENPDETEVKITCFTLTGQQQFQYQTYNAKIKYSFGAALVPGIYMISIEKNNSIKTFKLIKS